MQVYTKPKGTVAMSTVDFLWSNFSSQPLQYHNRNNLCAATSYVTSLLKPLFHFCIVCTTCIIITRPHPYMQPCKHGEWGERVHFPCGSPLGFEWYSQSLDVSLEVLNVYLIFISIHILCLVYTVQPLDNFTTCVNIHHFGRNSL